MQELIDKANNGNAEAQLELGFNYLQGRNGFPENDTEAFKWFKKAAGQNYPMGLCMVGELYQYGYGVARDYDTAVMWYKRSADLNCGRAEFRLGWLYAHANTKAYFGNNNLEYSPDLAATYYARALRHGYKDTFGILDYFEETGRLPLF